MTLSQKRIAAELLKCGMSRIRITSPTDVAEALTRADVRDLIAKKIVYKLPAGGPARGFAQKTLRQKKKGRRKGHGSRKGPRGSRTPSKKMWIIKIRAQRQLLRELVTKHQVDDQHTRQIYLWIKGGMFRNKKHLLLTLHEKGLLHTFKKGGAA